MKVSLRHAYFGWLLLLLLCAYGLLLFALSAIELHESRIEHTSFKSEMPEIAAFFIVMAATVPVIVFVAWHIAGRLLRPLRQVVTTAEHIRRGNFDERIPPCPTRMNWPAWPIRSTRRSTVTPRRSGGWRTSVATRRTSCARR